MLDRIKKEHPEYAAQRHTLAKCRDLYAGGDTIKNNAHSYLTRRAKEPVDVYYERLGQAFYENYVGSIVDWYAATLFRREPLLSFDGGSEHARRFYARFSEDCDFRGSSLTAFLRKTLTSSLVSGRSYVLIDFPAPVTEAMNRAEEELSGQSRAYLAFQAEELTNWGLDELGNFAWVVLKTWQWAENEKGDMRREPCWTYYDKQHFKRYREVMPGRGTTDYVLVQEGVHGLATLGRVPLFELKVPDGLWLLNKAASIQLEHFNKSNALAWAMQTGLFAMPIVYSEKPFKDVMGEAYYLQLGPNDRFGWVEPEGKVYEIAVENLKRLKDEIYRVCFLMSQAGGPLSSQAVSGAAKQRDYAVTQEVLRSFGDLVKDLLKRILDAVNDARRDDLIIDVAGLDEFDLGDFQAEMDTAQALLDLGIPSPTMKRQIFKRLAQKYLCDVKQELKNQILSEIETEEAA
jgi:hypothetical protein